MRARGGVTGLAGTPGWWLLEGGSPSRELARTPVFLLGVPVPVGPSWVDRRELWQRRCLAPSSRDLMGLAENLASGC